MKICQQMKRKHITIKIKFKKFLMQFRDLDIPIFMYIISVDGGMLKRRMILRGVHSATNKKDSLILHSAANRKVKLILLYNYCNSSRTIRNSYNI
jgi:hypothetical protein